MNPFLRFALSVLIPPAIIIGAHLISPSFLHAHLPIIMRLAISISIGLTVFLIAKPKRRRAK